MEKKHQCKHCLKIFNNGRALGGHMRSHIINFPLPKKPPSLTNNLSFQSQSASEEEDVDNNNNIINCKRVCYGLREKPKRSVRLEDPEFSSVILQDSETETDPSKNTMRYTRLMSVPCNYRSRRKPKLTLLDNWNNNNQIHEREAMMKRKEDSLVVNHEPLCSSSDVSTVEDVAFCLMMLSRDKEWKRQKNQEQEQEQSISDQYYDEEEDEEDEDEDEDEDEEERSIEEEESDDESEEEHYIYSKNQVRGRRYKCETCNKVFRSYQALGGHRASHKKIKLEISTKMNDGHELLENENGGNSSTPPQMVVEKRIHECPVCLRVFGSGQALGGHKRTHVMGIAPAATTTKQVSSSTKHGNSFIDLNLPAPVDDGDGDDEICRIGSSAVSDV